MSELVAPRFTTSTILPTGSNDSPNENRTGLNRKVNDKLLLPMLLFSLT